ncbi:spermidine synthase [Corynebacterium sp. A21]|uniref:spermidine synthase n=1 Tax=Corynebacterium sp. A21 TaxID=3457318 RepID=UPI003FD49329
MARKRSNAKKDISPAADSGPQAGVYQGSFGPLELAADPYTPNGWLINVNGVPSSHIVLDDPRQLVFEYMRWIATGVEAHVREHLAADKLRLTHLGGGACSLARYFADVYPTSRNTVVELDGELARLVREWFDIPRAPRVKIRVEDARTVAETFTPDSRDLIIRDVFAGAVTPDNLTTVEFFRHCQRGLAPGGLYVANCGDHSDLRGAKAEISGMLEVFAHVAVIADPPMLKGRRYGNIILLGSDTPLIDAASPAAAAMARELLGGGVPAQYQDEQWTRRFASGGKPRHDELAPEAE